MLTKMVNGHPVEMSAEEESAVLAEWATNQPETTGAAEIGRQNVAVTAERARAEAIADIERKMASGEPQGQILQDMLQLLKGKS